MRPSARNIEISFLLSSFYRLEGEKGRGGGVEHWLFARVSFNENKELYISPTFGSGLTLNCK